MDFSFDLVDVPLRLVGAVLLGAALGIEREWQGKPAGLRTHMIVALGAAAFTLAAGLVFRDTLSSGAEIARLDPLRVVAAVIGGIGFLGAGSIIQSRGAVEGLTTAGSLWLVGAVGVAAGSGHFLLAGTSVALGLLILIIVGWLERWRAHRKARKASLESGGSRPFPGR